jgi:hypothetical protein
MVTDFIEAFGGRQVFARAETQAPAYAKFSGSAAPLQRRHHPWSALHETTDFYLAHIA